MNTNMYALSHSERGWLMVSVAFLLSGIIYGLLIMRLTLPSVSAEIAFGFQVVPIFFLFSLSFGFLLITAGHYAFRQSVRQPGKEGQW